MQLSVCGTLCYGVYRQGVGLLSGPVGVSLTPGTSQHVMLFTGAFDNLSAVTSVCCGLSIRALGSSSTMCVRMLWAQSSKGLVKG